MTLLPGRLNARVIFVVSCILLTTGAASGWLTARTQAESLMASMRANSLVMVRNFADGCAGQLLLQDYAELENFLIKAAELPDIIEIKVCEPDGSLVWHVARGPDRQIRATTGIARLSPPSSPDPASTSGVNRLTVWQPIMAGNMVGWIKVDFSLKTIRDAQTGIWVHTLILAMSWVLCSAILIILVLRPIVRSIGSLTEFARHLDEHKGAQIDIGRQPLEIAGLGDSLNEVSLKLLSGDQQLQAEHERLRRYYEEVQDLYDRAPCGYHSLDSTGTFTRMNDTELQWLGYQREEIIGRHFTDMVTCRSQQTFREHFPRFMAHGWMRDLEYEFIRKDGTLLPALVSASALYDPHGKFLMSRATVYDITERKNAEKQEHLLSAIVQSSDDAIIAEDLDGIILSWNRGAERIYGYEAGEATGRSIFMLVPPERQEEFSRIITTLRLGEPIKRSVTRLRRKDGRMISVSITASPLRDAAGNIVGSSSITRDISLQMEAEEEIRRLNRELEERVVARTNDLEEKRQELEESQAALINIVEDLNLKTTELELANVKLLELDRLKSMFVASMSHELRTPLNSIIGFSSILRNEWLGAVNPEQKENLDIILRSGKHLLSLINDVIDVSKIEAGKLDVRLEEFELHELLTEAIMYVDRDLKDKGLTLRLELTRHHLRTDRRRLMQCVINLLSNAVKFTEKGGICVTTAQVSAPNAASNATTRIIAITVSDSGIGIPEADLPNLFKPFVRLESPLRATVPGTGLGLYLTRKLVEEVLEGTMVCTSEYGRGSSFTLRIPWRPDA